MGRGGGSFSSTVDSMFESKSTLEPTSLVSNSSLDRGRKDESNSQQYIRQGPLPAPGETETPDHVRVLSEQQILEQNGIDIDLKSLSLEAAKELSDRHKIGVIYNEVTVNFESIKERLEYLSRMEKSLSIDEAIEIADAAYLLKLLRRPEDKIELAGKMAHSGALLILQAEILTEKGHELLARSKRMLQLADYKPDSSTS